MKLNVLYLVLLLITSIKSNNVLDSYSIEGFKDYLKENDLFEIIQTIKNFYGQDVAIICCEELNQNYNGNCKKLVTDYMEEKTENTNVDESNENPEENDEKSNEESIIPSQSVEVSSKSQYDQSPKNQIELSLDNGKNINLSTIGKMQDILKKIFSPKELKSIKKRIKKRVQKLLVSKLKKEILDSLDSLFRTRIKIKINYPINLKIKKDFVMK